MSVITSPGPVAAPAGDTKVSAAALRSQYRGTVTHTLRSALTTFALTVVVVLAGWQAVVSLSGLSTYVAKGPLDVVAYFSSVPQAAENRAHILDALGVTLGDMVVGYAAGLTAAVLIAILFQLVKGLEHAFMPVSLLLASVPLISLAPLIIVMTGRSFTAVAVIGGIVVLFPSLVSVQAGLRAVSDQIVDVITVFGGSPLKIILKAGIPGALPAIFTAIRISVPGAITGALIAEWLATGVGLGSTLQKAIPQAQFAELWASVAVITFTSLVLYNLVRIVETLVLSKMGALRSSL